MYKDRIDAGQRLAKVLRHFKGKNTVVLALPRGGIVLGAEVAKELKAPLALAFVRKIGHPSFAEYAIGAVAEDEEPVFNKDELLGIDDAWLEDAVATARQLIERRRELYYDEDFTPPEVTGKTVILVDDGIATGFTMESAVRAMKSKHAKRVVVAVPVASRDAVETLEIIADDVIVLDSPEDFSGAVGSHYQEFDQVDDEQVRALLREVKDDVHQTITTNR